jgi:hypothetical protein
MASGKQIGDFSFKFTTFFNSPGPAGDVHRHVTWEGTATGFGTVFDTVTYAGGSKGGTFSECGHAFMDNGDFLNGIGQGTYESTGKHQWHTASFMQLSDGRRIAVEGEIDLAGRTWKGKIFEMS